MRPSISHSLRSPALAASPGSLISHSLRSPALAASPGSLISHSLRSPALAASLGSLIVWLAWLATAGCSGLDQIQDPVCGNGIIEPGEDCDSVTNCRQCALTCDAASCPDGFACGVDKLCHAPGGRFHPESAALPFQAEGFGVTDIDVDGYGDVVALGGTSLSVHHGDALGRLDQVTTTLVPFVLGQPAVTHLDLDDTLDIVIPTYDGLVAYTSRYKTMSPFPFAFELDTSSSAVPKPLAVYGLDGSALALLGKLIPSIGAPILVIVILDGTKRTFLDSVVSVTPVCTGFAPSYSLDRADFYTSGATHVVTMASSTGELCVIDLTAGVPPAYSISSSYLPAAGLDSRPVLARLGASPCPSVIGDVGGVIKQYAATGALGNCSVTLAGPRTLPSVAVAAATPVPLGVPRGHVPLGTQQIPGMGPDAVAYQGGVVAIDTTTAAPLLMFRSLRGIDEIHTLDIDGDGDPDAVTSSATFDDLELLYRYGGGTVNDGYLAVAVDTLGIPLHLIVGDFDGDGLGDVTYSEKLDNGERVMAVYGSRDFVEPPRLVSTYTDIVTTGTIQFVNSTDPNGRVLDMFVMDSVHDAAGNRIPDVELLSVPIGSPQRTLTPYYAPEAAGALFLGAVAGVFGATPNNYHDLISIAWNGSKSSVVEIEPTPYGAMSNQRFGGSAQLDLGCGTPALFCLPFAQYTAWRPTSDTPFDVVIALDDTAEHHIVMFDPQTLGPMMSPTTISIAGVAMASQGVETSLVARPVRQGDIDGDGVTDLIISYGPNGHAAPGPDAARGHVFACTADTTVSCTELVVPELAGWACVDATPANVVEHHLLDPPPTRKSIDLVVLCHKPGLGELFHVFHDASGYHAESMLAVPPTTQAIQLEDVTGDGVEDVLAVDNPGGTTQLLHVYPQCTSREVASCTAPVLQ